MSWGSTGGRDRATVRRVRTDDTWAQMAEGVEGATRKDGRPREQRDRMFREAVCYLARTGMPWRDVPQECGHRDAVSHRFRRWEKSGGWRNVWEG